MLKVYAFRLTCHFGDKKRDKGKVVSDNVEATYNLSYTGSKSKWNKFDIYSPKGVSGLLPVIVSIHGGGYIYGDKEVYKYYCSNLATYGFKVINFNYHLAPKATYPSILVETNEMMEWIVKNSKEYNLDINNVFMVGDSAGGQLLFQYGLIYSNPSFAKLFDFKVPDFKLKAVCLNCGVYDTKMLTEAAGAVGKAYFKKKVMEERQEDFKMFDYITKDYPNAFLMSAKDDFLKDACKPMCDLINKAGAKASYKIYGLDETDTIGHVFHVDYITKVAKECNDDEMAFFKENIS